MRAMNGDHWPGWDAGWMREVIEPLIDSGTAQRLLASIEDGSGYSPPKPVPAGVPLKLTESSGAFVRGVVEAYHRLITRIVVLHAEDERVRRVIASPATLADDLERSEASEEPMINLMRVDLLPRPDGGIRILETNANCPGGVLYAGMTARSWRSVLPERHRQPVVTNPLEDEDWLFTWLAETVGDRSLHAVALLRRDGGNRLELDVFADVLGRHGIDAFEASPCDVSFDGHTVRLMGRTLEVGYLKLGMQDCLEIWPRLGDFRSAVGHGALFVPNGQRSRWVGDSKLCLAVLSDPRFAAAFDGADYETVRQAIPWSRNLALCDRSTLDRISGNRDRYVLKHPLDTRGRGVFIGADAAPKGEWEAMIARGVKSNWLVQEFLAPVTLPIAWIPGGDTELNHDLAVFVANGATVGAFVRSSPESKLNVAGNGKFHPAFLP